MVSQTGDSMETPMIVTERRWGDRGLAFHPTGRYLASVGSEDSDIRIWECDSGRLVQCLKGHTRDVRCITYSDHFNRDHGYILVSAGWDKTIRFWDVEAGRELNRIETVSEINTIVYGGAGYLAAAGENGVIYLWFMDQDYWELFHLREYGQLIGHQSGVRSIAYGLILSKVAGLNAILASASDDDTVRLWSLPPDGKELYKLSIPDCWDVAFSPGYNSTKLAVAKRLPDGLECSVELWDLNSGQRFPFHPWALIGEYSNCVDFASHDVREVMALLSADTEASSETSGILGGYFDFLAAGSTKQSDPARTRVVFYSEDSENRIDCYLECPMGSIEQLKVWEGYYLAVGGRDGICLWGPQSISPGPFIMRELARHKRRIQEEEQRLELTRQLQAEREKLQSQAWLASGCCTVCGQKLGIAERLRGNTRCKAHR